MKPYNIPHKAVDTTAVAARTDPSPGPVSSVEEGSSDRHLEQVSHYADMRFVRYSLDGQWRTCTVTLAGRDLVLMFSDHDLGWIAVDLRKVIPLNVR